jgi:hypothetical protein
MSIRDTVDLRKRRKSLSSRFLKLIHKGERPKETTRRGDASR